MTAIETLMVQVGLDLTPLEQGLKKGKKLFEESKDEMDQLFKDYPALKGLEQDIRLSVNENFQENLISKALDPTAKLSDFEKNFLNSIEDIGKILKEDLKEASKALRETLKANNVEQGTIDIVVSGFEKDANKHIDDVLENFTDKLEEAAESLSKAVSEAFADMAIKGEFSAKKIGDAFVKTFLDIVSKELIQKPLEQILKAVFSVFLGTNGGPVGGTASGGAVAAGVPTLVNEQGQEIFIPHTPGRILNAPDSQRLLGGGSQVVVYQNLKFDTAIKNDMMATIFQASPLFPGTKI